MLLLSLLFKTSFMKGKRLSQDKVMHALKNMRQDSETIIDEMMDDKKLGKGDCPTLRIIYIQRNSSSIY